MNFDTRTVMDIISLNDDLKKNISETITQEQLFSENIGRFNSDEFIDSITPMIKDTLKIFLKKNLKSMGLSLIKNHININNVDYKYLVNEIASF